MSDNDHFYDVIADYGDACAEMQAEIASLRAELVAKDARIAELEGRNKHMKTVLYDAQCLLGTEDIGELITAPDGPIVRLIARAEKAEADCKRVTEEFEAYKVNYEYNDVDLDMAVELEMTLRKRAVFEADNLSHNLKEANAKIAAAHDRLSLEPDECDLVTACEHWVANWHEENARAEQAEAQLKCCQNDKATLRALTEQAETQLAEAKAQRDVLREALTGLITGAAGVETIVRSINYNIADDLMKLINKARAALAPSPARREGVGIDSVPSCGTENDYRKRNPSEK